MAWQLAGVGVVLAVAPRREWPDLLEGFAAVLAWPWVIVAQVIGRARFERQRRRRG